MVGVINMHFSRYLRAMGCNGQARPLQPSWAGCFFSHGLLCMAVDVNST